MLVVTVLSLAAALAACDNSDNPPTTTRTVHAEGHGPLSAGISGGGNGLFAPSTTPWRATFGGIELCTTTGDTLTLEDVRYHQKVPALDTEPTLRRVPAGGGDPARAPVGGRLGTPGHFTTGDDQLAGDLSTNIDGQRIDGGCDANPTEAYTELLTVAEADKRGAWIDEVSIDYTDGQQEYTLNVDWNYVMCGSATQDDDVCGT